MSDIHLNSDVRSLVDEHIENFILLLLVFDEVHLPLDNFQFLASDFDYQVFSRLLSDPRFKALADSGLITTNEHDRHDLKGSWELYGQRARKTGWSIKELTEQISFDALSGLRSYASRPMDQSNRFVTRLNEIIGFSAANIDLRREHERWLKDQLKRSFDDYGDGSVSAEHLAQRLIQEAGDFPIELRNQLLIAINRAFFETFANKSESTYSYISGMIKVKDPQTQVHLLEAVLYSPQFLKKWLFSFLKARRYRALMTQGVEALMTTRHYQSWRPFVEQFHGAFSEKIVERYTNFVMASDALETEVKYFDLIRSESYIARFFDISIGAFHASVKPISFIPKDRIYRFEQRVTFGDIMMFIGNLEWYLDHHVTPHR